MKLYKIKKSNIDNKGLYAVKNIKSGKIIINYKGKIITKKEESVISKVTPSFIKKLTKEDKSINPPLKSSKTPMI